MGVIANVRAFFAGPVGLITIHHEGAGAPCTKAQAQRFSEGGYCYAICTDGWVRFRSPAQNWATFGFNHKDLTICYSGDRHTGYPLSDNDIKSTHEAFMDCLNRKEVQAQAQVRAHRNSPGSSTVCPGDHTMARWPLVVAACRQGTPTPVPVPDPVPEDTDMLVISVEKKGAAGNQKPYAWLDPTARKVWSCWALKIAWDGGTGDSPLQGTTDPKSFNIPGSAPLVNWKELEYNDDGSLFDTQGGTRRRVCAYGLNGAEYNGTAHG